MAKTTTTTATAKTRLERARRKSAEQGRKIDGLTSRLDRYEVFAEQINVRVHEQRKTIDALVTRSEAHTRRLSKIENDRQGKQLSSDAETIARLRNALEIIARPGPCLCLRTDQIRKSGLPHIELGGDDAHWTTCARAIAAKALA